jgi:hypothetical protein
MADSALQAPLSGGGSDTSDLVLLSSRSASWGSDVSQHSSSFETLRRRFPEIVSADEVLVAGILFHELYFYFYFLVVGGTPTIRIAHY